MVDFCLEASPLPVNYQGYHRATHGQTCPSRCAEYRHRKEDSMCIITSKEERVGRSWDEPARHVSNYHAGPARRTSPLPRNRRRYSNYGNDYRSSDNSVRYGYRSSQPSVSYPRRDIRVVER